MFILLSAFETIERFLGMRPKQEEDKAFLPQFIVVFMDHGTDVGESFMQLAVLGHIERVH